MTFLYEAELCLKDGKKLYLGTFVSRKKAELACDEAIKKLGDTVVGQSIGFIRLKRAIAERKNHRFVL